MEAKKNDDDYANGLFSFEINRMVMRFSLWLCLVLSTLGLFSQGYFLEFKMSGVEGVAGNMKIYAQGGVSRSEVEFLNPNAKLFMPDGMAVLNFEKEPTKIYMLNTAAKTYSEITTTANDDWKDYNQADYTVAVVGKENVNGYNATHVKIKVKGSNLEQDLWTSTEVAGYYDFYKVKTQFTGKENLYKALQEKGAAGFPVRMLVKEKGMNMQMDLVRAEKKKLAESLFTLDGYTKGSSVPGLPADIDISKLQNLKNLSPEEQEKMMEELLKSFQSNPKAK